MDRRLLGVLLAAAVLCPSAASATYSLIHSQVDCLTSSGGTTAAQSTTGADLIVLVVASNSGVVAANVSDSASNTWTLVASYGSAPDVSILYAKNASTSASHTFTISLASSFPSVVSYAFSGSDTTAPLDASHSGAGNGNGPLSTGSITPAADNEVIVTGLAGTFTVAPTVTGSMSTPLYQIIVGGTCYSVAGAYKIQTTATAINPAWDTNGTITDMVAAFKAAAGGGGGGGGPVHSGMTGFWGVRLSPRPAIKVARW